MQRQSLGSPVSKLHIHGGGGGSSKEDLRLTELHPSSSSSSSTSPTVYDDDDESKTTKPRRFSLSPPPLALSSSLSTHSRPEKLIHLIPLLTLFCFLVLYFSSHSPSPSGRCTYSLVSFFIFHFFVFFDVHRCVFVSDLAQFHAFQRPSNRRGTMQLYCLICQRSVFYKYFSRFYIFINLFLKCLSRFRGNR